MHQRTVFHFSPEKKTQYSMNEDNDEKRKECSAINILCNVEPHVAVVSV